MTNNEKQDQVNELDYTNNGFETISVYTEAEAVNDGILVSLGEIQEDWAKGIVNYVTSNLLNRYGYVKEDGQINIPNLLDLLNIVGNTLHKRVQKDLKDYGEVNSLYDGIIIEAPSGKKFEAWAEMNSSGYFTLLLPEDH